jgi:hypothetical protein
MAKVLTKASSRLVDGMAAPKTVSRKFVHGLHAELPPTKMFVVPRSYLEHLITTVVDRTVKEINALPSDD